VTEPLLSIRDLVVEFPVGRGRKVHAVSGVDLDVQRGETVGLVGESGCGKSSLGSAVLQLPPPTSGSVRFEGQELTALKGNELRTLRRRFQMIFQDPISSLNPRRKVFDIVSEPLAIAGIEGDRRAKVNDLLEAVGLDPAAGERRPHQFSGGQCQRISIARSLVLEPELLICDEPVSALDVSVQAQILNLLEDMKARYGLTMLFIAHDLAVVKNISDRVAVMYLGRIVELAPADALYRDPRHPYTAALLAAIPVARPNASAATGEAEALGTKALRGELPSPLDPPSGCRFRTRCPRADQVCADVVPPLVELAPAHHVACHHPLEVAVATPTRRSAAAG
jgi:peptide/nickel transport system ATP-binding protein